MKFSVMNFVPPFEHSYLQKVHEKFYVYSIAMTWLNIYLY